MSLRLKKVIFSIVICAVGFVLARFSPINYVWEPGSFVLFIYVPIFLAMFISPFSAFAVAAGSALGLFLLGMPMTIIFRAVSHITFALFGALYISLRPEILEVPDGAVRTSFLLALLNALCQVAVVFPYYFSRELGEGVYSYGFSVSVVLLVGFASLMQSMAEFFVALLIWNKSRSIIFREIDW